MASEYLLGSRLYSLSGRPVPLFSCPHPRHLYAPRRSPPSLLFSRQHHPPQLFQPLPTSQMLRSLQHLCRLSPDSLRSIQLSRAGEPTAGHSAPEAISLRYQRSRISLDLLVTSLLPNAAQRAGFATRVRVAGHGQLGVDQDLRVFFYKAAFQPVGPPPLLMRWVILPSPLQDFTLLFDCPSPLHKTSAGPFLQPVESF